MQVSLTDGFRHSKQVRLMWKCSKSREIRGMHHPNIFFFLNGQVGELFETYVDAPGLSINKPHQSARAARGTSDSLAHGESAVAFPGGYRHVACSSVGPDASLVCVKVGLFDETPELSSAPCVICLYRRYMKMLRNIVFPWVPKLKFQLTKNSETQKPLS